VYEIITATPLGRNVSSDILRTIASTLGVFGMAEAGILSVSYDTKSQTGILRVAHTSVAKARAALTMTTHLGRTPVCIRTLGMSGILAKSKRFLPEGIHHEKTKARALED